MAAILYLSLEICTIHSGFQIVSYLKTWAFESNLQKVRISKVSGFRMVGFQIPTVSWKSNAQNWACEYIWGSKTELESPNNIRKRFWKSVFEPFGSHFVPILNVRFSNGSSLGRFIYKTFFLFYLKRPRLELTIQKPNTIRKPNTWPSKYWTGSVFEPPL